MGTSISVSFTFKYTPFSSTGLLILALSAKFSCWVLENLISNLLGSKITLVTMTTWFLLYSFLKCVFPLFSFFLFALLSLSTLSLSKKYSRESWREKE